MKRIRKRIYARREHFALFLPSPVMDMDYESWAVSKQLKKADESATSLQLQSFLIAPVLHTLISLNQDAAFRKLYAFFTVD